MLKTTTIAIAGLLGSLAFAAPAAADCVSDTDCAPQFEAGDVLGHVDALTSPNGTTRSITGEGAATRELCIGTFDECTPVTPSGTGGTGDTTVAGDPPPPDAPKPEFNLLISFNFDSAELTPQARANLREFARALQDPKLDGTLWAIDGHTDAVGGPGYNQNLSVRRANAVVSYLAELGIERGRLKARGFGESRLYDPADPEADINRRVEALPAFK